MTKYVIPERFSYASGTLPQFPLANASKLRANFAKQAMPLPLIYNGYGEGAPHELIYDYFKLTLGRNGRKF